MIDHILGRPSPTLRRTQIFLVLFFWVWRLYKGDGASVAALPTRITSASGPLPSGHAGGLRLGKGRSRVWWLRMWMSVVGKKTYGLGWMGRLNERLSESSSYGLLVMHGEEAR
jgi:hypothetical protein